MPHHRAGFGPFFAMLLSGPIFITASILTNFVRDLILQPSTPFSFNMDDFSQIVNLSFAVIIVGFFISFLPILLCTLIVLGQIARDIPSARHVAFAVVVGGIVGTGMAVMLLGRHDFIDGFPIIIPFATTGMICAWICWRTSRWTDVPPLEI